MCHWCEISSHLIYVLLVSLCFVLLQLLLELLYLIKATAVFFAKLAVFLPQTAVLSLRLYEAIPDVSDNDLSSGLLRNSDMVLTGEGHWFSQALEFAFQFLYVGFLFTDLL